jgi:hypothetical protein
LFGPSIRLYAWQDDILEKQLDILRISFWKANVPGEDHD